MVDVEEIIKKHFPDSQWNINEPPAGMSTQARIADNGREKVFIKFDVKTPALSRLSELGVTPSVVYDGTSEERPYIIQEFVEGEYPDRSWFSANLQTLAEFIKKYQQDQLLKDLLSKGGSESYEEHIQQTLTHLKNSINDSKADIFETDEVKNGIDSLKERGRNLKPTTLVPTHADPNSKNFLLTNTGLTMVDWDDILLSDPMRDVGLMLWWYIPKDKWSTFFEYYGQDIDEEKIYWWTARASLSIAAWFANRGDLANAKFFTNDFLLAIQGKDNSQIYINNPN
jgi:thiamine kinase-like enzyme